MNIETEVFKKYKPDFKKLEKSCLKNNDGFIIEKKFQDDNFKAVILITKKGNISSKVIEVESNDEFLPLRIETQQGEFVGQVRKDYKNALIEIRKKYFYKNCFTLEQSNRITDLIFEKYNANPEFLWEKPDGAGVFRNPNSKKWFGIIMDIDRSKIQKNKKGFCEIMNVKLSSKTLEKALKEEGFYPAYHMNKKYWITFILDETIEDKRLMELIEESYNLTSKK